MSQLPIQNSDVKEGNGFPQSAGIQPANHEASSRSVTARGTAATPSHLGRLSKSISKRRKTSHLKDVPPTLSERTKLRSECQAIVCMLDRSVPLTKNELETISRKLLEKSGLPECFLGWTMTVLASEFWREQVASVPYNRRLLLLPHCLKHAEGCPADYDEFGLDCEKCGACSIADFRSNAEKLGYKVLVAEGSPIVLKIIISGHVDAIVGVACLNVLEKAIDKILLAGIPCMAVPLLSSDCRNTSVDEDWVDEMIHVKQETSTVQTASYLHLMRLAGDMFTPNELERLAPRLRGRKRLAELNGQGLAGLEPIAATEAIAYDFLAKGGKHSRPFVTLATYDALTESKSTQENGATHASAIPDYVRRTAMSIETFHKASLVHDDIEDNDAYRYGDPTLHHAHGVPTAINVGDYLIGLGYQLVTRDAAALGGEKTADILHCLADAHLRLSEGQGAELAWRDARDKRLTPLDALKIYALKTAPAFEAALYCGVRLAGEAASLAKPIKQFARHLGIGFQILNDLKDWHEDQTNKRTAGGDVLGGRPTVLLALALEALSKKDAAQLLELISLETPKADTLSQVRALYNKVNIFELARNLVEKHHTRAAEIANEFQPKSFQRLAHFLIETILHRPEPAPPQTVALDATLAT